MRTTTAKNVLGTELEVCSLSPTTGWFRDGCCRSGAGDVGLHLLCARMTREFLEFSLERGATQPDLLMWIANAELMERAETR